MIIIADSHVSEQTADEFFRMLELIEKTEHPVVFLGDIFDLWIAVPRYEKEVQKRFVNWCDKEKKRRTIGLIEGNHEFFVSRTHGSSFTWSDGMEHDVDKIVFTHGDMVKENDWGYRLLRFLSKNLIMKTIFTYMPRGQNAIDWLEVNIGHINPKKRYKLPEEDIEKFSLEKFSNGKDMILMGHFHQYKEYEFSGKKVILLPDWMNKREITILDIEKGSLKIDHFDKILT